jgi:hypothetical protein
VTQLGKNYSSRYNWGQNIQYPKRCITETLNTVILRLKAGIVQPGQTFISRQQLSKHVPAARNTQAAIEELPFLCNGEVNTLLWQ